MQGVTTVKAYTFNTTNSSYADATLPLNDPVMTRNTTDNTCTCAGYIKEIQYTIRTIPQSASGSIDRPYFRMDGVNATVIISNDPITV